MRPSSSKTLTSKSQYDQNIYSIVAVNLARLTDTTSILPATLYCCCQLDGHTLMNGAPQDVRPSQAAEKLAPDDLARCINGKAKLAEKSVPNYWHILDTAASAECLSREYCEPASKRAREESGACGASGATNALFSWRNILEADGDDFGMCQACVRMLMNCDLEFPKAVWNELPLMMGVDTTSTNWPKLKVTI